MPGHNNPLSQRWTDILPLLPPQQHTMWWLLSGVVLLALVLLVVYVLWQQTPRRRALRALQRCGRQLQAVPAESRRIAHTAHRVLLQGLRLNPATVMNETYQHNLQWQNFYRRLQQCVFQAAAPDADELAGLIRQACDWLRQDRS